MNGFIYVTGFTEVLAAANENLGVFWVWLLVVFWTLLVKLFVGFVYCYVCVYSYGLKILVGGFPVFIGFAGSTGFINGLIAPAADLNGFGTLEPVGLFIGVTYLKFN